MSSLTFDTTKYYLGKLCKHGHEYEDSGKSLRVKHGDCVECKRLDNEERLRLLREQTVIKRQERQRLKAIQSAPIGELEALHNVDTSTFKLGTLCSNNHNWNDSGYSLRYKIQGSCTECRRQYIKEYYEENKEQIQAVNKKYAAKRPEVRTIARANYRQTHREKIRAASKEYNQRKEVKARVRERSRTPAAIARLKRYWQSERGKLISTRARQKRRARKKQVHHWKYTDTELKLLYEKFNNVCAYCGSTERLTIDHAVPLSKGGSDVLGNLLPACMTCNCSKHDSDIKQWYKNQSFYSKVRWKKIQQHLSKAVCNGQITLF